MLHKQGLKPEDWIEERVRPRSAGKSGPARGSLGANWRPGPLTVLAPDPPHLPRGPLRHHREHPPLHPPTSPHLNPPFPTHPPTHPQLAPYGTIVRTRVFWDQDAVAVSFKAVAQAVAVV
jgi:hypothetical protein